MSYIGSSPKVNRLRMQPRSSDPANPAEGDLQYADGSVREEGVWVYKNSAWVKVGSDQPGNINYISNGDAETGNTTGWSLGNVTLTSNFPSGVPTFGSGASANLSFTNTTVTPLAGTRSFLLSSSAATTAGNFLASDAFTIDSADLAKVLTVSFVYQLTSGTGNFSGTSSNSFGIAIYDVTASTWIYPAGAWAMTQSSGVGQAVATFQTPITSTQYRLVIFNANATSGAVSLEFDRISVSPTSRPVGAPVTDFIDAGTITINGTTSNPTKGTTATDKVWWKRVGDTMHVRMQYKQTAAGGSAGSGDYIFRLPSGYSIDLNKVTAYSTVEGWNSAYDRSFSVGTATFGDTGISSQAIGNVVVYDSTGVRIFGQSAGNVWGVPGSGGFATTNTGVFYSLDFVVPIAGWSSQVQMSGDTDTRVISTSVSKSSSSAALAAATDTTVTFTSIIDDKSGSWNGTDTYTIPVTGSYIVSGALTFNTGASTTNVIAKLYKNGALYAELGYTSTTTGLIVSIPYKITVPLSAGDTLQIKGYVNAGTATTILGNSNKASYLSIDRLSGPAVVAASETVACRYSNGAGTVTNTTFATLPFTTKAFDTHNAFNGSTGVFTAPVSGKYAVSSQVLTGGFSGGVVFYLSIFVNGVEYSGHVIQNVAAYSASTTGIVNDQIQLNAGDLVTIRARNSAGAGGINASSLYNWVQIRRVGN